jgi:membrane protein implicated in regulation of membrane protease activity
MIRQFFHFYPSSSELVILAVLFIIIMIPVVYLVIRAHRGRITTGPEALFGRPGEIVCVTDYTGKIRINGELWYFRSEQKMIPHDTAEVISVDEMVLVVRKMVNP